MSQTPNEPATADDPRLLRAAQEYLAELEAGRRPDRRAFAARFADLGEALAPYLDALDMVHGAAPLLNQPPPHAYPLSPCEGARGTGFPLSPSEGERGRGEGATAAAESLPAEPLGDFSIVRQIGRGGMGIVYEAVQLSLGRRVALKVLPFAATMDPRQLQRFHNEARAAANLHHPNIVPVYAVGCERGVHFYAMQLIEGQNLATLLEELRRGEAVEEPSRARPEPGGEPTGPYVAPDLAAGAPAADTRPGLGAQISTEWSTQAADYFRTVARLTLQAAGGLDYAHGLGIVHRDVKPGNILVDGRGNVWVTDFGLAQFHADAALTQTGDLLGTLRYMSPEQASGRRALLDHRTDVYSLGATLYELLTLRPIFDGTDRQTLLHQILHDEPRPPRSIDAAIPAELETIVLKAVSKAPAERYATAQEFADDLRRYLEDKPILARRPTLRERVVKWSRRHRSVVVSAVVCLVLAVAGLLTTTLLLAGANAQTTAAYERERQQAAEARAQRARAEENFRQARRAVDFFAQIGEEELSKFPPLQGVRRRLLMAALEYYQEFIEQQREDPSLQADLAASHQRVTRLLGELSALQGHAHLALLTNSSVQKALKVTPQQTEQIVRLSDDFVKQWRDARRDLTRLSAEERQQKAVELTRGHGKAMAAVLTPDQAKRLKQIAMQIQNNGPHGFRDPDVVAALKLTRQQQEEIRKLQDAADVVLWERFESGGDHKPPRPRPDDVWAKTREKILDLLTPQQRAAWKELTGEPFVSAGPIFLPAGLDVFGPPRPGFGSPPPKKGFSQPPWH
jgi:hypothetical protein